MFQRFSLISKIKNTFRKLPSPKKEIDFQILDIFKKKIDSLNTSNIPSHQNHPINHIAISARNIIRSEINNNNNDIVHIVQKLNSYLLETFSKYDYNFKLTKDNDKSIPIQVPKENELKTDEDIKIEIELSLRLFHTYQYFQRFLKSCKDQELSLNEITTNEIIHLLDVLLRGNTDERIVYHMLLYEKEQFNQERLQEAFYSLYESEIQTCTLLLLMNPNLHKHHVKKLPIYSKTYLLDKADLNMKLRCVLAWSDPKYSGFQPIAKEFNMSTSILIQSRRQFYPEGTNIATQYIKDYISTREEYYNNKEEFNDNFRKGVLFMIATLLLDWGICSL